MEKDKMMPAKISLRAGQTEGRKFKNIVRFIADLRE